MKPLFFQPLKSLRQAILAFSLITFPSTVALQAQDFVDDFDLGDINDRWVVQRNAVGTVEIAQEGGQAIVTATTVNANGGLASIASFDPLADGIYVKFVFDEIVGGSNANGFLVGVVDDNTVFHRNTNNFGIAAFGQDAKTASAGGFSLIAGDQNGAGQADWILDEGQAVDRASFQDGFTMTITADVTGWTYLIEGLQDLDLVDQVYENSGTWADAGTTFEEIFGGDSDWHVLHGDQSPGQKVSRISQISLGDPKPASDPDIRVTSRVEVGQLPSVPEIHERTLSIRNAGEAQMLTVSAVEVSGLDAEHYAVAAEQFPLMIAPGEPADITFSINSLGETGSFQGILTVVSNDPAPDEDTRVAVEVLSSVINLNGPIANFPMDEESGTDMRDVTGFGRDGTFGEGVVLGAEGLAGGSAIQVAGGAMAMVEGRAFDEGTFDEFSVSIWFQADDIQTTSTLIANGSDGSPIFALIVDAGELSWFLDSAPDFSTTSSAIEVGKTHHAVVTYSADSTVIYVDGEPKGTGSNLLPDIDPAAPVTIGSFGPLGFTGSLDAVQIYDRAISSDDVQYLFGNPGSELGTSGPVDSDGDGLTDADEVDIHMTDPLIADTDGDELSDGEEVAINSNPLVIDTDGGGTWDGFEVSQGTDPTIASDDPAVWTVRTLKSRNALSTLSDAETMIQDDTFSSEITKQHTQLNFLGTGANFGNFDSDLPFDNIETFEQNVDDFAVIATTEIFISEAGTYSMGFNSDDGGRLSVGGAEVAVFETTRGPNDSIGNVFLAPGFHEVEVLMFDRAGGSAFEVFWDSEPGDATDNFDAGRHQLFVASSAARADSDGDGLDDNWENALFNDLSRDGTADSDDDGLTDLAEFQNRTDPTNADSDSDGVNDGPEVNTHGTNPLNRDTDGDLRTDGAEINEEPLSNPLVEDTDGDGFRDGFEVSQGSDPDDATSLPTDRLGEPDQSWTNVQGLPTFNGFRGGADTRDVTFRVSIDFDTSGASEEEREMIWESGGGTVGFSLVYESGSRLVLRAAGNGGNSVATVDYALTAEQIAAGTLSVIWTYDVDNGNPEAAQTISLYLDEELVGEDSQNMGPDWTGTDGAAFGIGTASFAAGGGNTALNNGIDFSSGTIDLERGLQMFIDTLFVPEGGGDPGPSDSDLTISAITRTSETITLIVDGGTDLTGDVEHSTNLEDWTVIQTGVALDTPIVDEDATRLDSSSGYYRIQKP